MCHILVAFSFHGNFVISDVLQTKSYTLSNCDLVMGAWPGNFHKPSTKTFVQASRSALKVSLNFLIALSVP